MKHTVTVMDGEALSKQRKLMMTEINKESEAYNTGFEAAKQGEPRTANPYAAGTWDSDNWFAGWDDE
jgi:hypothetical protein